MSGARIAIIIRATGSSERLPSLLERLAGQSLPTEQFEVVAEDDGLPMPRSIHDDSYPYSLQLIRRQSGEPTGTRNRALARCSAPLVLFLDDDAVPDADLLERHLELHESAKTPCAALGRSPFGERALESPLVQLLAQSDLLYDFVGLRDGQLHDWRYFWTFNLSIPLSVLQATDGFDPAFDEPLIQDAELGYRLQQLGCRVLHHVEAHCVRDEPVTLEDYFERMHRVGANWIRMWRKHGDPTILGVDRVEEIEPTLQSLQLEYERIRERFGAAMSSLSRLENAHAGRQFSESARQDTEDVIRSVRNVPFFRGIAEEMFGQDPERVAQRGPAAGQLTSVVVTSRNDLDGSKRALEGLRRAAAAALPMQIIVVDNASSDGSVEYLREQSDVTLIESDSDRGIAHARNQAMQRARGTWIILLDTRVIVCPGWLDRLRYHAEIDPAVGCVAPATDHGESSRAIAAFPLGSRDRPWSIVVEVLATEASHPGSYRKIASAPCLLVARKVVERIGGFDEHLDRGFEGDDFTFRAHLAGFRTRIANDVRLHGRADGEAPEESSPTALADSWRRFVEKWGGDRGTPVATYNAFEEIASEGWSADDLYIELDTDAS